MSFTPDDNGKVLVLMPDKLTMVKVPPPRGIPRTARLRGFSEVPEELSTMPFHGEAQVLPSITRPILLQSLEDLHFAVCTTAGALEFVHITKDGLATSETPRPQVNIAFPGMIQHFMGARRALQTPRIGKAPGISGSSKLTIDSFRCITYGPRLPKDTEDWECIASCRECSLNEDLGKPDMCQFDEHSGRVIMEYDEEDFITILDF